MRVVEASISILIILSILFILYNRGTQTDEVSFDERGNDILDELASNITFRTYVLDNNREEATRAVASKLPESYISYEVRICEVNDVCGMSAYTENNVYVSERVISSSLERGPNPVTGEPGSKKVKLFIWRTMR